MSIGFTYNNVELVKFMCFHNNNNNNDNNVLFDFALIFFCDKNKQTSGHFLTKETKFGLKFYATFSAVIIEKRTIPIYQDDTTHEIKLYELLKKKLRNIKMV